MYVCVLMALTTTLVLCARSQDLVMSMPVRRVGYTSFSRPLDLRAEESRVVRHVKPLRCGEASRWPGSNPSHRCAGSGLLPIELPERQIMEDKCHDQCPTY